MATLDRKTKRLLDKLHAVRRPSKKSSKNAELSSETLSVLTELEAPSKKVRKKHKKPDRKNKITSVTRKAIAHVTSRRPTKSTGPRGKVRPLEEETRIALLKLQAQGAPAAGPPTPCTPPRPGQHVSQVSQGVPQVSPGRLVCPPRPSRACKGPASEQPSSLFRGCSA